ncbi:protoglobin domain-containing protein [Rhodoferax sp.]|uniref:protoglobin domain-containing protein n=1 Tax=Rhodoferax sp. TaxID=50421 RepID=UPI0025D361DA|nr:protoglobin domain-containing protein [Rhodoferax sp.]
MRRAGTILVPQLEDFVEEWYVWLRKQPEYLQFFPDTDNVGRVSKMQTRHWQEFFAAEVNDFYVTRRTHVGAVHAHIELPNDIYFAGVSMSYQMFVERLRNTDTPVNDVLDMALAISKLLKMDTFLVMDTISRITRERIADHSRAMMEMSTPVTPIWEGILLLPLVGIIDTTRTAEIMNKTLTKIAESRSKVFVLDISGVASVDTSVANQLIKITKATRLMGCESIISGVSPSIARTMVELGVSIGEVRTTATLRDAFELALRAIGVMDMVPPASTIAMRPRIGT